MNKNQEFDGKRLLVLGESISSCEIVQIAKRLGAYTIAVDYLEDSAFKKIADKQYLISTADLDALEEVARAERVDGVLAGASEFNIDKAITLSERLGLPFYASREQWDILSNKAAFKELCRKFQVPVVEEYDLSCGIDKLQDIVSYPIIIKPVDGTAGMGISVCKSAEELQHGYEKALGQSKSGRVIAERYMTGDEVVIYYTLQDGYISLSSMCDRYTLKQPGVAPLPLAYIYPSRHLKMFQKYDNQNIRQMFESLGMKNGFLFIQAFIEDGRIRIYEMGYRIAGAQGHKPIADVNGINPLEMLVRFALGGGMSGWDLKTQDDPAFKKWACKLTPVLKAGKIGRIEGLEAIRSLPGVTDVVPVHHVGDTVDTVGTLKQLLARIFFVANSQAELVDLIDQIQNILRVFDGSGNDMLMDRFDTSEVRHDVVQID